MAKAEIVIGAKNTATPVLRGLRRSLHGLRTAARGLTRAFKSMAGGVVRSFRRIGVAAGLAGAGIALSVREAHQFAKAMAEVQTMMSGGDIAAFAAQVRQLSGEFGMAKDELAKGLYQVLSAGVPEENAIDFLRTASQAAMAGVTDVETAVDALSTVINAYQMDASEAARVSDIMFATVKKGKTTFGELASQVGQVAGIAAQAGVEFGDIAAAIATITKQGIGTETAVMGLRQSIIATLKPSADLQKKFDALGVSGEQLIRTRGLQGALQIIAEEAKGSTAALTKLIPNIRALPAVLALTGKNAKTAASDLQAMADSAGAATDAFEIQDKVRHWERLWQSVLGAVQRFGDVVNRTVAPIIDRLAIRIGKFTEASPIFEKLRTRMIGWAKSVEKAIDTAIDRAGLLFRVLSAAKTPEMQEARKYALEALKHGVIGMFQSGADLAVEAMKKAAPVIGGLIAKAFSLLANPARNEVRTRTGVQNLLDRGEITRMQAEVLWTPLLRWKAGSDLNDQLQREVDRMQGLELKQIKIDIDKPEGIEIPVTLAGLSTADLRKMEAALTFQRKHAELSRVQFELSKRLSREATPPPAPRPVVMPKDPEPPLSDEEFWASSRRGLERYKQHAANLERVLSMQRPGGQDTEWMKRVRKNYKQVLEEITRQEKAIEQHAVVDAPVVETAGVRLNVRNMKMLRAMRQAQTKGDTERFENLRKLYDTEKNITELRAKAKDPKLTGEERTGAVMGLMGAQIERETLRKALTDVTSPVTGAATKAAPIADIGPVTDFRSLSLGEVFDIKHGDASMVRPLGSKGNPMSVELVGEPMGE